MLLRTLPVLLLLLLANCETAPKGCNGVGFTEYDRGFEIQFADELEQHPPPPATDRFIVDAKRLRNEVRACKGLPSDR